MVQVSTHKVKVKVIIKPMASITLFSEEIVAMQKSIPKGTRLQDIPPFPVAVEYEYDGVLYNDVIQKLFIQKQWS